jgi:hypothetical protein
MYRESKVLTIHTVFNDRENSLQKRSTEVLGELEKVNNYLKDFKNGVCDKILQLAVEMIQKLRSLQLTIPEEVMDIIISNMKNIFKNDKIAVYLNSEDERILETYARSAKNNLQELEILTNDFIELGECKFDYDFLKLKLRILQNLKNAQDVISQYYDSIIISETSSKSNSENDNSDKSENDSEAVKSLQEYDSKKLLQLLINEEPNVIAVILMNLSPVKTAEILWQLPFDLRYEVVNQIAVIGKISKDVVEVMFKTALSLVECNSSERVEFNRKNYLKRKRIENNNLYLIAKRKY